LCSRHDRQADFAAQSAPPGAREGERNLHSLPFAPAKAFFRQQQEWRKFFAGEPQRKGVIKRQQRRGRGHHFEPQPSAREPWRNAGRYAQQTEHPRERFRWTEQRSRRSKRDPLRRFVARLQVARRPRRRFDLGNHSRCVCSTQ
jgi:hypothetical protein